MFEKERGIRNIWIQCPDGAKFSIAVGESAYCTPRDNDGPYTQVEIGYPSVVPPQSWLEHAEGTNYTDTVYPYLPVELIADFINEHRS